MHRFRNDYHVASAMTPTIIAVAVAMDARRVHLLQRSKKKRKKEEKKKKKAAGWRAVCFMSTRVAFVWRATELLLQCQYGQIWRISEQLFLTNTLLNAEGVYMIIQT